MPDTLRRHLASVCELYRVDPDELRGPGKARHLCEARRDLLYRLTVLERWSLNQAGRKVGGRDHTSVMYNVRVFAEANGWPPKASLVALREAEEQAA
jgi:chromosomal replication initiator protein